MIGHILDEKYRIDKLLGRGGMGAVYLATHLGTKRPVALKVIIPQFVSNTEFIERFKREAEAAGRLRHPNVVNVTDFGFARSGSEQLAYLVMEYLDGYSLATLLKEKNQLTINAVVDIIEQVCLAVGKAHQEGIIHRDLKPDNIWLEPNGGGGYNIKVLDFGLAKIHHTAPLSSQPDPKNSEASRREPPVSAVSSDPFSTTISNNSQAIDSQSPTLVERQTIADHQNSPRADLSATCAGDNASINNTGEITQVGAVFGTPLYMSPEQCLGERLDLRSDIYSLGIITYQMLTGETPFTGATSDVLLAQHIKAAPPPLQEKRRDIPKWVADLVMTALAKDPAERPATAQAFAGALRARAEGPGVVMRRAIGLYSEHLSTALCISLLANIPTFIAVILLLAQIPLIKVTLPIFGLFFVILTLTIFFAFGVNRAAFTIFVEQLLLAPLRPVEFCSVLESLKKQLKIPATASQLKTYPMLYQRLLKVAFSFMLSPSRLLCVSVMVIEGTSRRATLARSKELRNRLPHVLKGILLFLPLLVILPTVLFFFSTFGVAKALGAETQKAVDISLTVAIILLAANYFWLVTPAPIAVAMLYFRARQAGGETLAETARGR